MTRCLTTVQSSQHKLFVAFRHVIIMVAATCPVCGNSVLSNYINEHIDSSCENYIEGVPSRTVDQEGARKSGSQGSGFASIFQKPNNTRTSSNNGKSSPHSQEQVSAVKSPTEDNSTPNAKPINGTATPSTADGKNANLKRTREDVIAPDQSTTTASAAPKKSKPNSLDKTAPLAERMRPKSLDEVCGQDLVGPNGVLRGLIEQDRVPSMVLWGGAGSGKTTIARLIARTAGTRFVEINSTSSGVAECKKIFAEAKNELSLTGRKTVLFCDEIHRFSKAQQDVFLGPVEAGQVTLIAATTENPSFKVINPLLSRCRTFTLAKLTENDVTTIMKRALDSARDSDIPRSPLLNDDFLHYLAAFAEGDARTALNLLELAMDLSTRPNISQEELKHSLTHTLVYDRAGDQHYDTISALHKSIRGGNPDASLYYLARMLQSGEDALYIARRLMVVASEDIGLADNSMLSLAAATYTACEKVGMPEARINLAHAVVALSLSKKSTRAYRGLANANKALQEPGIAGLPIPLHLRNAPTRLMKEIGYGKEYKYNPEYKDGNVIQQYLPDKIKGKRFLEDNDLGHAIDPDLSGE